MWCFIHKLIQRLSMLSISAINSTYFVVKPLQIDSSLRVCLDWREVEASRVELAENMLILDQIYSILLYSTSLSLNSNKPLKPQHFAITNLVIPNSYREWETTVHFSLLSRMSSLPLASHGWLPTDPSVLSL